MRGSIRYSTSIGFDHFDDFRIAPPSLEDAYLALEYWLGKWLMKFLTDVKYLWLEQIFEVRSYLVMVCGVVAVLSADHGLWVFAFRRQIWTDPAVLTADDRRDGDFRAGARRIQHDGGARQCDAP